jgi:hypothetical protein
MEIHADVRQKVHVNPLDVINGLIEEEIGWRGWVVERDGKYYRGHEVSAGSHSFDKENKISKDLYDYVKALELVHEKLTDKE